MQRFKSSGQAQRFLEPFSAPCNHFRPRRHRFPALRYRQIMGERFQAWREVIGVVSADLSRAVAACGDHSGFHE